MRTKSPERSSAQKNSTVMMGHPAGWTGSISTQHAPSLGAPHFAQGGMRTLGVWTSESGEKQSLPDFLELLLLNACSPRRRQGCGAA